MSPGGTSHCAAAAEDPRRRRPENDGKTNGPTSEQWRVGGRGLGGQNGQRRGEPRGEMEDDERDTENHERERGQAEARLRETIGRVSEREWCVGS